MTPTNLDELRAAINAANKAGQRGTADHLYLTFIRRAIEGEGIPHAVVPEIVREAWGRGHSSGYEEVISEASVMCDFAKRVIEASKLVARATSQP